MNTLIKWGICCLFVLGILEITYAQTMSGTVIDPGIRIRQEQETDARKQQTQSQKTDLKKDLEDTKNTTTPSSDNTSKDKCIELDDIKLNLNGLQSLPSNNQLIKDHTNKCFTAVQVKDLMQSVKKNYTEAGYFQVQISINKHDLVKKALELDLQPARLEAIKLKPKESSSSHKFKDRWQHDRFKRMLNVSFPTRKKQILRFADLETGIDALNNIPSIDARLLISPGKEKAETLLYIDVKESDRMRGNIGFNNQGQPFLGTNKFAPSLQFDNLLNRGDTWTVSYFGNAATDAVTVTSKIPIKPKWILSTNFIYSDFLAGLANPGSATITDLYGKYKMFDFSLTRQMYRKGGTQIYASWGGSLKGSERELGGFTLADQNETVLYTNAYVLWKGQDWQANLGGGIHAGLPILDATVISKGDRDDIPDGRFIKFEGFANLYRQTRWGLWHSSLTGQIIPQAAYGLEHLVLGGMYSVRGYSEAVTSAEQGFLNRNELEMTFPIKSKNTKLQSIRKNIHPVIFFDHGAVQRPFNTADPGEYLASLGGGFRINWNKISFDILYGFPLIRPSQDQDFQSGGRLHFSFNMKVF